ncbi:MAG TPA: tRNA lysidine(34) synthetase TilS [Actinomycetes bacterium]
MARAPAALRLVADLAARALATAGAPRPGDGVAVAVSGGADSVALLHAMHTLAGPRAWRLGVLTVDHGLRPGSAADAAFVAEEAGRLGLPVRLLRLAPEELGRHRGAGPEGAARAARYAAMLAAADEHGWDWLATGHTEDDQAETVLLQLLRGAGPDGLAGMAVHSGRLLRPLLRVQRAQTRACCAALGIRWREDPSNQDQHFLRNAVRARVLPLLEELRPGSAATLARAAELARDDRAWTAELATRTLDDLAGPDGAVLACEALAALPLGLARRVVRAAASRAGHPLPAAAATDAVLDLAAGRRPGPVAWAGRERACRDGARLRFLPA